MANEFVGFVRAQWAEMPSVDLINWMGAIAAVNPSTHCVRSNRL